jgi:hypothetical protein
MRAMPGARLAFAADGRHLAFLGSDVGPPAASNWVSTYDTSGAGAQPVQDLGVVWVFDAQAGPDASAVGWRAPLQSTEQLVDVSWSPQADRLLVVAGQTLEGGAKRSRAWFVGPSVQHADTAMVLPSDVAPGTEAWSPDGTHVAFIAHAGQINALCLLGTDGSFRYVADLDPSTGPPSTYPPLSWSADGQQLVFVAPHQHVPGSAFDWLAPGTQHALFRTTLDQPTPAALTDTAVDQVTWREDGQLLGLWRPAPDAPLAIRALTSAGQNAQDLVQLPLKAGSTYTSMWDLAHAQLLVSSRGTGSTNEYWLVRLGLEDER